MRCRPSLTPASPRLRPAQGCASHRIARLESIEQREHEEASAGQDRNQSELVEQLEQIDKDLGRTFPQHTMIFGLYHEVGMERSDVHRNITVFVTGPVTGYLYRNGVTGLITDRNG